MASNSSILEQMLAAQSRVFRLAQRYHGLSLKEISDDSGIPYSTLATYANGTVGMPLCALLHLIEVIPDGILSNLLAPANRCVGRVAERDEAEELPLKWRRI